MSSLTVPTWDELYEHLQLLKESRLDFRNRSVQLEHVDDTNESGILYTKTAHFYGALVATNYVSSTCCEYLYATDRGYVFLWESNNWPIVYKFGRMKLEDLIDNHKELLHNLCHRDEWEKQVNTGFDPNYFLKKEGRLARDAV